MIIDTYENCEKYYPLHKDFKLVFDYIKSNNSAEFNLGRHEIRGDEVYFNLQEYQTKPEQKLEAHKKYIDIQAVIEGAEYMGYTNIKKTSVNEEYDAEKDVMFLNGSTDKVKADNKTFVIFFPSDAHMPALSIDEPRYVKKAIFKIRIC